MDVGRTEDHEVKVKTNKHIDNCKKKFGFFVLYANVIKVITL